MAICLHTRVFGSVSASRCASQFAAAIAALLIGLALTGPAAAQDLPGFSAGGEALGGLGRNAILLVGGLTLLSLAPGLAIMVTCFPFVVTVLSILRQSIGLQQSPPNMLIVSLAIFLSWYVMDPVLRDAWQVAGAPLQRGEITLPVAFERGVEPFRRFMAERIDPDTMAALADVAPTPAGAAPVTDDPQTAPLSLIVPSFMLSEIQKAFAIGFLVSLPFLIIDLVVSAILMSMGMMMVPPTVVALPFKLAFFVAVDGWGLLASALVRGYQGGG
ncbi:flagellar biosynthetic protein FliP [Paracoccus sanguinis]|uniref:Flagellar biosynthetic protein FliP n=1 Tax=Paracoccus sanguinis TaxID=1545044 RepID=A0A1H2YCI9_9RHOB|nr:flagellar type III secretion system pore protein FliP [Paracoccus sanguinis]SDX02685.1 flagellar biosynthetic protein FliP [Paracoccus sanguinis]